MNISSFFFVHSIVGVQIKIKGVYTIKVKDVNERFKGVQIRIKGVM